MPSSFEKLDHGRKYIFILWNALFVKGYINYVKQRDERVVYGTRLPVEVRSLKVSLQNFFFNFLKTVLFHASGISIPLSLLMLVQSCVNSFFDPPCVCSSEVHWFFVYTHLFSLLWVPFLIY